MIAAELAATDAALLCALRQIAADRMLLRIALELLGQHEQTIERQREQLIKIREELLCRQGVPSDLRRVS